MSGATATGTSPGGSTTVVQRPSGHRRHKSDINLGSLLRLFKSGFFDSWLTISYLYRYPTPGVHDYLVNELYKMNDVDIEFYVFQLCSLLIYRTFQTQTLERFIMDKCSKSAHFAAQIAWILEAAIEDNDPNTVDRCKQLREDVEVACVHSCRPQPRGRKQRSATTTPPISVSVTPSKPSGTISPPFSSSSSITTPFPQISSQSSPSDRATTSTSTSTTTTPGLTVSGPLSRVSRSSSSMSNQSSSQTHLTESDEPTTNQRRLRFVEPAESYRSSSPAASSASPAPPEDAEFNEALAKKDRLEFFNMILGFVQGLGKLSDNLKATQVELRPAKIERELQKINQTLSVGLYLPIMRADEKHHCIVRLVPDTAKVLNSRERVPYLFDVEVLESEVPCATPDLHKQALSFLPVIQAVRSSIRFTAPAGSGSDTDRAADLHFTSGFVPRSRSNPDLNEAGRSASAPHATSVVSNSSMSESVVSLDPEDFTDLTGNNNNNNNNNDSTPTTQDQSQAQQQTAAASSTSASTSSASRGTGGQAHHAHHSEETLRASKFPLREFWEDKKARIRRSSPFGSQPNWNLLSVIYKHGDDLRQEQLAIQLIKQFHTIFQDAGLPLYLKPYHILVTSGHSGLIEVLRDAVSIHQLKKEVENFGSLSQWFKESFNYPSREYMLAQRNFVESLAGYSIVTHLLAIKDRHNGNILIDAYGKLIHIDYGFMLTNSPGNMNFESSPFKLTQEYIDVMDGVESSTYQYFKALLIRGFIEVRKHTDKVVSLVEMMLEGSALPCFHRGEAAAIELRERFCQSLTEDEYVAHIEGLIEKSANNWNTRQYDKFQLMTNSILY